MEFWLGAWGSQGHFSASSPGSCCHRKARVLPPQRGLSSKLKMERTGGFGESWANEGQVQLSLPLSYSVWKNFADKALSEKASKEIVSQSGLGPSGKKRNQKHPPPPADWRGKGESEILRQQESDTVAPLWTPALKPPYSGKSLRRCWAGPGQTDS